MIILRRHLFAATKSNNKKISIADLYPETEKVLAAKNKWTRSRNGKDAANYLSAWTEDIYIPARSDGFFLDPPDKAALNAAIRYHRNQYMMNKNK